MLLILALLMQIPMDGESAHYSLGGAVGAISVYLLVKELRAKTGNGNSNGLTNSVEYWDRMEDKVTRPIVEAINHQRDGHRG